MKNQTKVIQGDNEVLYKNQINDIAFKKFKEADYNLFFAIVSRAVDNIQRGNNQEITLDYSTIKKLAGFTKHITNKDFWVKCLKPMVDKLLDCHCSFENDSEAHIFTIFTTFKADHKAAKLTVKVNEDFYYLLSDFDMSKGGFTKLELKRFVGLESKYTKTLYRNLRRFKATGKYKIKADDLREIYDIPKTYKHSDIMKRVINPSIKELSKDFKNLKCDTHNAPKQGAPVDMYIFTFVPVPKTKKETEGQSDLFQAAEEMRKYKKQKAKEKNTFNNMETSPSTPKTKEEWSDLEEKLIDN